MADLAARHLGAGVVAASDDAFGPKELLLSPGPVSLLPGTFDHKGEVVDGWETRRRRTPGADWAVARLGCGDMAGLDALVSAAVGVPVVDGVAAAVAVGESLVRLGLRTSNVGSTAPPDLSATTWPTAPGDADV